ncbi:branched-chain amino acid ABC transporter permease [Chloroflexota bacterium]
MKTGTDTTKSLAERIGVKGLIALALAGLAFLVPTAISNPYYLDVAITMVIYIVLVSAFHLMSLAGEYNIALPAFMAIGAYTAALLTTKEDWSWWLAMFVAGLLAAIIAAMSGRAVLRVKGIYFAILGFAMVIVLKYLWYTWDSVFEGYRGVWNVPSPDGLSGSLTSFYYLGLCLALLTILVVCRLEKSRYGLIMESIGQADDLTESVGVSIMKYKLWAFVIGAFFAGIIGSYFASVHHFVHPKEFDFQMVLFLIVYAVAGGLRSFAGPIVGVIALSLLTVGLKEIPGYDPKTEPIIFGGILVCVMLFLPGGLISLPEKVRSLFKPLRGVPQG